MHAERREQLEAQLSAYLDGELTAEEVREVEAFLAEDAAARGLLDDLRATVGAVRSLPRARAGDDLMEALRARLERRALLGDESGSGETEPLPVSSTRPGRWMAAAAVIGLTFLAGYMMWPLTGQAPDVANRELAMGDPPARHRSFQSPSSLTLEDADGDGVAAMAPAQPAGRGETELGRRGAATTDALTLDTLKEAPAAAPVESPVAADAQWGELVAEAPPAIESEYGDKLAGEPVPEAFALRPGAPESPAALEPSGEVDPGDAPGLTAAVEAALPPAPASPQPPARLAIIELAYADVSARDMALGALTARLEALSGASADELEGRDDPDSHVSWLGLPAGRAGRVGDASALAVGGGRLPGKLRTEASSEEAMLQLAAELHEETRAVAVRLIEHDSRPGALTLDLRASAEVMKDTQDLPPVRPVQDAPSVRAGAEYRARYRTEPPSRQVWRSQRTETREEAVGRSGEQAEGDSPAAVTEPEAGPTHETKSETAQRDRGRRAGLEEIRPSGRVAIEPPSARANQPVALPAQAAAPSRPEAVAARSLTTAPAATAPVSAAPGDAAPAALPVIRIYVHINPQASQEVPSTQPVDRPE